MATIAVILGVLLLVTAGYLVVVLRQIRAVGRQLERRLADDVRSTVTLALAVPALEALVARVNDTVRQARAASTRTRVEERRIRSFIADISHDLRTPLTTVRGHLQLLARTELDESQRARVGVAQRHADDLGALVDRLYEYAYLLEVEPRLDPEPVDVGVLVGECLLASHVEIEQAGLEVRFEPPSALLLLTDREKLTRILQNLIRNAVQHGRETLEVEVVRRVEGGAGAAGVDDGTGDPGGATVEIRLRNRIRPGDDVDADRLFDRFYTADGSRSGRTSGLGLSIVRALAEQLGARAAATLQDDRLAVQVTLADLPRP